MTPVIIAGGVFLAVAILGTTLQVAAARQLTGGGALSGALLRTVLCRVVVGVGYIGIGINAVWWQWHVASLSLAAFAATQCLWVINSRLDVALRQRMNTHD